LCCLPQDEGLQCWCAEQTLDDTTATTVTTGLMLEYMKRLKMFSYQEEGAFKCTFQETLNYSKDADEFHFMEYTDELHKSSSQVLAKTTQYCENSMDKPDVGRRLALFFDIDGNGCNAFEGIQEKVIYLVCDQQQQLNLGANTYRRMLPSNSRRGAPRIRGSPIRGRIS
jgi:hypothetical protein